MACISPGESPILRLPSTSWVNPRWSGLITRETIICVDPHVMRALTSNFDTSVLKKDLVWLYTFATFCITCGSTQICTSRVNPRWSGQITRETIICVDPHVMWALTSNFDTLVLKKYLAWSCPPIISNILGINCGESQICISRVNPRWYGSITRETQNLRFPTVSARPPETLTHQSLRRT